MLFGIADRLLHHLEMVQQSEARIVMQIRRGDRQSMKTKYGSDCTGCPSRNALNSRYSSTCTRQSTKGNQLVYLASLLNQHTPKRCLRSSSGVLLDVPQINLERFGRRAFACAGPTLWNNLPTNLRVNDNHTQFKKQIVDKPTRKGAILDKILTNMADLYPTPEICSHLGKSDHNIISAIPCT